MVVSARTVLVTGGAGFVGVNLGRLLRDEGFRTRCFDNFTTGSRADAEAAGYDEIVEGDIRHLEQLAEAVSDVDLVVHLAAQSGVPTSVADPVHDCELNVRGTLNALIASRDAGVQGFVMASSSAPLGPTTPPVDERTVPRPISPYGASKLAGEAYCSAFAGSYGLPTVALRFTNVYGPYSYHKGSVVAAFCKAAASDEPMVIHGDGSQTRDFVFVEDLCRGMVQALTSGAAGMVAHLGSGTETSIAEVANEIAVRFPGDVPTQHVEERVGDIPRTYADISLARRELGYNPTTSLQDGLDATVAWFREADLSGAAG
ncbi:SDR family oxidoreductase [Nocardioides marmoribigeumensis]